LGGKGNEGVTGLIRQSPGAIGYIEMNYAISNKFAMAALQNAAGDFVLPSIEAVSTAADESIGTMPADYRVSIVNAAGKKSYPISAFTYLLISEQMDKYKGQKLLGFLKWAMAEGQKMSASLQYAPLPPSLIKQLQKTLASIELK
jgi:phosphate transport system substrate-binding protein